jgi:diaminopimelate epimerase
MEILNTDGSKAEACGNGTRCVASLLSGESGKKSLLLETVAGLLATTVNPDGSVTVDMGRPRFGWQEIPLVEPFHDTRTIELQIGPIDKPILHTPSAVNVGNPHCIFWVDDVDKYDLGKFGPMLEHHRLFPERANISLAQVTAPDALTLRVWERGAGLTRACGTAACAAAVAAARKRLTGRKVKVTLPGGPLLIEWRADDHMLMTGPCERELDGFLDPVMFTPLPS